MDDQPENQGWAELGSILNYLQSALVENRSAFEFPSEFLMEMKMEGWGTGLPEAAGAGHRQADKWNHRATFAALV